MAPKKKKVQNRARKERSHGLWIAPDLERTIKGEGGRRGLSQPPYSYYLQLADLALRSPAMATNPPVPKDDPLVQRAQFPFETDEPVAEQVPPPTHSKSRKTIAGLKRSPEFRVATQIKPPKVTLPKTQAPKPPKLTAPKPPKSRRAPKLSPPKPPKRRR